MARILTWLGGALFVASLGYAAYFYAVVLADPTPVSESGLAQAIAVDALLFGVFALHHSLLARTRAKRLVTRVVPERMERSVYVWIASILFAATCWLWQLVPGMVYDVLEPARWVLYALQGAGLVLIWRAAAMLDGLELAGIRQLQGRVRPVTFKASGPFGLVRHPIYLGWILMVFGAPAMTINRLVFAIISSVYLVLAIPWEERSLLEAFGDRYRAYQGSVRWRLVPGIW